MDTHLDTTTALHAGGGFVIGSAVTMIVEAPPTMPRWARIVLPRLAVAVAGVGKELLDESTDGRFDWTDAVATQLGGELGIRSTHVAISLAIEPGETYAAQVLLRW